MTQHWAMRYVGVQFKEVGRSLIGGVDCYGLLFHVYRDRFQIDLPLLDDRYASTGDRASIAALVREESSTWQRVDDIREGDVVVFRVRGVPLHVGVMLDARRFLHVLVGANVVIEVLDSPHWARRVVAFYRHAEMLDAVPA